MSNLEPQEVLRYERHAAALGRKIEDAEDVAQALALLELFERHVVDAITRLHSEGERPYSWAELAAPTDHSRQGLQQWHARRAGKHLAESA